MYVCLIAKTKYSFEIRSCVPSINGERKKNMYFPISHCVFSPDILIVYRAVKVCWSSAVW